MKKIFFIILIFAFWVTNSYGFTFYGIEFGKPYNNCFHEEENDGYVDCAAKLYDFPGIRNNISWFT